VPAGELAPGASAPSAQPRLLSAWGQRLASPLGVMIVIPLLVGVVGVFLAFVGHDSLTASNLEVATERMDEHARRVADSVSDALSQADPLLRRLSGLAEARNPDQPVEALAHALADLMRGRPGVSYLSLSFPDGTFQGAYVDEDAVLRFQVSRVTPEGPTHVWRYDLGPRGTLVPQREETTSYDPRRRPFYRLAVSQAKPAWTDPYPFFGTYRTGITRTAPVFTGAGDARRLHAVVTVDFDVRELSSQLGRHRFRGTRALLFARDGAILAYAADASGKALPATRDSVLSYRDLHDPVIDGLFEKLATSRGPNLAQAVVEAGSSRHLIALSSIAAELELPWSIAYIAPEEFFLHRLHSYQKTSAWIGALGLVAALAVAFAFARAITRVRREAASARADAAQARREAKELGSYRLTTCLGKGAMGEVWRAEHRLLARQAAIKLINPALHGKDSPEIRERFRREAETLATLKSRNTIELFDYGVAADGTFFFVMELLEGMDLDSLVERHGPQPVERVVALLLQACASLAEAHDRGLVHRDIKPANLFVCRAADEVDVVKVLDFGLVRADASTLPIAAVAAVAADPALITSGEALGSDSGRLTQAGGLMGTPAFMPPEQATGQELDGRADLYALACVAVWLLSGSLVYPYVKPMQLVIAHVNEPVPDLRARLPPSVPDALAALLTRCLQKLPSQRPEHVRAFAAELRTLGLAQRWTEERAQAWWSANFTPAEAPAELASAPTLVSVHPR
jgi:serine/threonine protein kinase